MTTNRSHILTTIFEFTLLMAIFWLLASFYAAFDPSEMRTLGLFPWDSGIYKELADQFSAGNYSELTAMYPFGTRILFPFLYAKLSVISGIPFVEAAYFLNLASAFLVTLFCFYFWRSFGISRWLAWTGILFFMVSWLGPLRYSGFYPGGSFAFESLLICAIYVVLAATPAKPNPLLLLMMALLIFAMACGREFVTYTLLIVLLTKYFAFDYRGGRMDLKGVTGKPRFAGIWQGLRNRSYIVLLTFFLASALAYAFTHALVHNDGGKYSVVKTVFNFAWFHLHPGEFLYPLFYALGPLALIFLFAITFRGIRTRMAHEFGKSLPNADLIAIFAAIGLVFCMVGGTDSDRFLLWFFPFYALIGFKILTVFGGMHHWRMKFSLLAIFMVGLMWTRFYVPAIPHLLFPGEAYNPYAGVRTNFDPALFYGPSSLQSYRKPLKDVPLNEAYVGGGSYSRLPEVAPKISASIGKDATTGSQFKGTYKFDVNINPIPFGYPHNQYELLTAHPFHGDPSIRITLLVQWLLAYSFLFFFNRKWLAHEVKP